MPCMLWWGAGAALFQMDQLILACEIQVRRLRMPSFPSVVRTDHLCQPTVFSGGLAVREDQHCLPQIGTCMLGQAWLFVHEIVTAQLCA